MALLKKSHRNYRIKTPCPCGTRKEYLNCCKPVHKNHSLAERPSQLMRARYSAYVLEKTDFLLKTWALETRPSTLEINHGIKWLSLDINKSAIEPKTKKQATISFCVLFLDSNKLCKLKETSRFIYRSKRWYYLDGEMEVVTKLVAGNSQCPCNSGKKYKRCCKC